MDRLLSSKSSTATTIIIWRISAISRRSKFNTQSVHMLWLFLERSICFDDAYARPTIAHQSKLLYIAYDPGPVNMHAICAD